MQIIGCTVCPIGKYNPDVGKTACTNCPAGSYNPSTTSTDLSACLLCPAGTSSVAGSDASTDCTACSAAYYSTGNGGAW